MPQDDRVDFTEFQVESVIIAQDGVCVKCGGTLEKGFHRHHLDGDHTNNSVDNLQLLCASCHRAEALPKLAKEHRSVERKVFRTIDKLIKEVMGEGGKKLAGTTINSLKDLLTMQLRLSRNFRELDKGIEYYPPSFAMMRNMMKSELLQKWGINMWKLGFSDRAKAEKELLEDE